MPRKLKVYQTSQGFYDLALAAPSMKAALEAWGASSNLFHQGFAKESDDSDVIAAAMANPGIVLKRPVGSNKPFREDADLPTAASLDLPRKTDEARPRKAKALKPRKTDKPAERRAAAAFEKQQAKREKQREKEEAAAAKTRAKRQAAMDKAEAALADARREHEENSAEIEKDLAAVQHRAEAEEERWQKVKDRLEEDVRRASRF
jgi:colicin import membrane protein